jgi:hypothetical protein
VSISQDLIPEAWADAVGEEFVGTRFDEHPDSEEQFRRRVNAGEHEWGKGPLITTTYNYTGLVLPSAVEGEGESEEPEILPVRLTFKRTTKDAHQKIMSLKRATNLRNKDFWAVVFHMETESKSYGRNDAFIVKVKKGRPTTPEEQEQAIQLALAVAGGRVSANESDDDSGSAPRDTDAKGGLAV